MPWLYFPLLTPGPRSLISRNVNLVYSHFPSPIELTQGVDTLRGQVLLTTSAHARALSVPRLINLEEVRQPISPQHMNLSYVPVGITLEGRFSSLYAHRPVSSIAGGQQFEFRERGPVARMAIIADGSIARNDVRVRGAQTQVLPLGFDRFTQQTFGNKELLSNVADVDFMRSLPARSHEGYAQAVVRYEPACGPHELGTLHWLNALGGGETSLLEFVAQSATTTLGSSVGRLANPQVGHADYRLDPRADTHKAWPHDAV